MSEIYRDSTVSLSLGLTGATNVSANVRRAGAVVFSATGDTFDLPFSIVGYDGPFVVDWTFTVGTETATRTEAHDVVTPYLSVSDIRAEISGIPAGTTDAALIRAERRVRKTIDNYCGQTFGKRKDVLTIFGKDGDRLRLPERLIGLDSIGGQYVLPLDYYGAVGDGWYLGTKYPYGYDDTVTDFVFTGVIRDPFSEWQAPFHEGYTYTLSGTWGWDSVPEDVREAALILVEYELCPDKEYRDRYVTSVGYADTKLNFSPSSFQGTGSATADKLLSAYVRSFMTAI